MTETAPSFENRIGGLRFFGVLEVAIGVLCALLGGLSLLAVVMTGGVEPSMGRMMIPSVAVYLFLAAWFVTLGVGSFRARRWAQALGLATGWLWLATGVMAALMMVVALPRILQTPPGDESGVLLIVGGCTSAIVLLFFILLPLAIVLFYRRPSVRATVERLDPVPRWTDPLPTSVLAFVILWGWMGVSTLTYSFAYRALPLGSTIVRGVAATAIMFAFAALALWVVWGSIRLRASAWWTALALFLLGGAFSFTLFRAVDFAAWYEAMDVPMDPTQIAMIEDLYASPAVLALMGIVWVCYVGWLLWIRRYFFGAGDAAVPGSARGGPRSTP